MVSPAQSTESATVAVTAGMALTVTVLFLELLTQPFDVTVTEYTPELLTVVFAMLTIGPLLVNPLGPLQVNVAFGALEAAVS
jgi:hypothetical protein